MISGDDVMPLLLQACPSFLETWRTIEEENGPDEYTPTRLHYVDAGEFAAHLVELHRDGEAAEVAQAFAVIERLHLEGDDYVRELATIGYLEGVQNVAGHRGLDEAAFESYLGPETRRWWKGLNAFWSGQLPGVQAVDD